MKVIRLNLQSLCRTFIPFFSKAYFFPSLQLLIRKADVSEVYCRFSGGFFIIPEVGRVCAAFFFLLCYETATTACVCVCVYTFTSTQHASFRLNSRWHPLDAFAPLGIVIIILHTPYRAHFLFILAWICSHITNFLKHILGGKVEITLLKQPPLSICKPGEKAQNFTFYIRFIWIRKINWYNYKTL